MNRFSKVFISVVFCTILTASTTAVTNSQAVYAQSPSQMQQMQQQQQVQQQQQQLAQQQRQTQLDPTSSSSSSATGIGSTQPGRVGIHDNAQQTSPEGANPGGTVTDPTLAQFFPDGTVKANCFGVVISDRAQEHKENPDEGTLGSHASDPVPEIPGHETPRQGIGNQDQGTPAAHGAFNSQFDPDDLANAQANC